MDPYESFDGLIGQTSRSICGAGGGALRNNPREFYILDGGSVRLEWMTRKSKERKNILFNIPKNGNKCCLRYRLPQRFTRTPEAGTLREVWGHIDDLQTKKIDVQAAGEPVCHDRVKRHSTDREGRN